ncbi:FAD-dependent oxidoreductase [Chitinophaga agri]|uniref:FAD-dependent oxidoreductase n=1 Tax=Chitinophaga agri TaxID=2703787 RepID=A0A6B9ZNG8_9BACT|nr:FAD-dependent oxidoreductase [Chitinophaga agri]QHS63832.1 FAD-dependent oxidoreductase [Chitinophaga agri]
MINRDGAQTSLWQGNVQSYLTTNRADRHKKYDVVIIGGGITGITTGLLLQEAGKQCLIVEAEELGFGTTGGTTAHLNTLLDVPYYVIAQNFGEENAKHVAHATAEALNLIRNNVTRFNIDCGFQEADAYLFAQDEDQEKELDKIRKSSADAGLNIDYITDIPVTVPFRKAVRATGQAKFNPLLYIQGLAKAFEAAGGTIIQQCRVINVTEDDTMKVATTSGVFSTVDVVYATHIPPGINLLHLRCSPYRSYAMAVTLEDEAYPEDLSYDMYDPYHYYRTQIVNGQRYLIIGGEDHKTGEEINTDQCFRSLEAHARKHFSVKEIVYRWSSQYFEPTDGLPYIGYLPGHEDHVYVASGFGGNGMTYGTVSAQLLKCIIMKENATLEKLFDPNRIKPVAGFTSFVTHNTDVIKEFFGKLFSADELKQLSDLAPGEGKLVRYHDKKVALYKNEEGKLFALNPTCTHMKCDVKWNQTEKSWDCPCHGARYNYDGKVITGPADADLEGLVLS